MDHIIEMAIFQRTPDLSGELSGHAFPQSPVADNVVEHLPPVHILEHHVVVVLMDDHLAHSADIWVV